MRSIGNILWHIPFLGFLTALSVFLLGLLLTVLVVTAPIGMGLLQYARFLMTPYTSGMVSKDDLGVQQDELWKAYSTIIMILFLPFGLIIACIQVVQIVGLCITIVGIPVAIPLAKSLGVVLNPVGKVWVSYLVEQEVGRQKVQKYFENKK